MSMPWFRLYAEFSGDPVMQSLAFEDQRHYIVLLCLKCSGLLDRPITSSAQREQIIARGLGLDLVSASEAKKRLQKVGLIDKKWRPMAWDKRQFVSDVSTERVRKYRKLKESGNVSETENLRLGNAPDTDTDTDTDTDKNNHLPDWLDKTAWDEFIQHRKEIKKPMTPLSAKKCLALLEQYKNKQREIVDTSIANGWRGLFPPKESKASGGKPPREFPR